MHFMGKKTKYQLQGFFSEDHSRYSNSTWHKTLLIFIPVTLITSSMSCLHFRDEELNAINN